MDTNDLPQHQAKRAKTTPAVTSPAASSLQCTLASPRPSALAKATPNNRGEVFIVALCENRTREVGFAAINLKGSTVHLAQFCDSHTYVNVITMLYRFQPRTVLMPHTTVSTELYQLIKTQYPESPITNILRKFFSETQGTTLLKDITLTSEHNIIDLEVSRKYLCLAAAASLIKYIDVVQHVTFAPNSLRVEISSSEGAMFIDSASIKTLEVIAQRRTGDTKQSLFGVLNNAKTKQGSRLLKSNLLQPPSSLTTIKGRIDAVTELVTTDCLLMEVRNSLNGMLDLENLMALLVHSTKKPPNVLAAARVTNILSLKLILEKIPYVRKALGICKSDLLSTICEVLSAPELNQLYTAINATVQAAAKHTKIAQPLQVQQCFAVKPGVNGLLDASRQIYQESLEAIYALADKYKVAYQIGDIKIQYSAKRGYYITISSNVRVLPQVFVESVLKASRTTTTEELVGLNDRIKENVSEIILISDKILTGLMDEIRTQLPLLYRLADSIALLDLLGCFAYYASTTHGCVSPEFTLDGPLVFSLGRHPILEKFSQGTVVPNNVYASDTGHNFHVISGPNMSGKSTYLSQICLLTIMAHVGCYIPANFASIRLTDRLTTRIGTEDSIETNCSSFLLEMKEMAYIVNSVTSRALVVIDELGRSTAFSDAVPLCFGIWQSLTQLFAAYTFFVTHFSDMAKRLEAIYPNVKCHHLAVNRTDANKLSCSYSLEDGCYDKGNYGIDLAEMAGFPTVLIEDARDIRKRLGDAEAAKNEQAGATKERQKHELIEKILLLKNTTLDQNGIRNYLSDLKKKYQL